MCSLGCSRLTSSTQQFESALSDYFPTTLSADLSANHEAKMARQAVLNSVEEKTTGYITREKLVAFLRARYPNVSSVDEFDIKVRLTHVKSSKFP
jgi:hypothetical protein